MRRLIFSVFCAWIVHNHATAFSTSASVNATIPDGDFNGIQNTIGVSGLSGYVSDINVTLTVAGGFNGDLYAYLYHNGTSSILLNRVGRTASSGVGYADGGFGTNNSGGLFTFDDQATQDVHLYRTFSYTLNLNGQLTGAWQPDGRAIAPLSPGSIFDSANRSGMLSLFDGADPNGNWTLFITDVSSGGEGTLMNWGLSIASIPEPGVGSLLMLASISACWLTRSRPRICTSR